MRGPALRAGGVRAALRPPGMSRVSEGDGVLPFHLGSGWGVGDSLRQRTDLGRLPEAGHQLHGIVQRREVVLGEEACVKVVLLERVAAAAALGQELDQPVLRLVLEGIGLGPLLGEAQGDRHVAPFAADADRLPASEAMQPLEAGALLIGPALEGGAVREEPPREERTAVAGQGLLVALLTDEGLEGPRVDLHGRPGPEALALGLQPLLAEGASEPVEGLAQGMTCLVRVVLGPEDGDHGVPRGRPFHAEKHEKRRSAALRRELAHFPPVELDVEIPQDLQGEHCSLPDDAGTARCTGGRAHRPGPRSNDEPFPLGTVRKNGPRRFPGSGATHPHLRLNVARPRAPPGAPLGGPEPVPSRISACSGASWPRRVRRIRGVPHREPRASVHPRS